MTSGLDPRVMHVSEVDALRDLAAILKRVQAGVEVVIERDSQPSSRDPRCCSNAEDHLPVDCSSGSPRKGDRPSPGA
jgi:hypothetical protein